MGERLPIAPVVPFMPTAIPPATVAPSTVAPSTITPAWVPIMPAPTGMPVVPVTPPHWLSSCRGIIAWIDLGSGTLAELLLNLLHTDLQRLGVGRLSRTGIGRGGGGGR